MFFEKMIKNYFCGGEAIATSEAGSSAISPNEIMAILTILILFSIVLIVKVLLLAFLQFNSSGQNRFLIDKRNFLSIIDNTGLIDKKSKKLIFPHP